MMIEEVNAQSLKKAPDTELYVMRLRFIQLYNKNFQGNTRLIAGELKRIDLLDKYRLLVREMRDRGLKYEANKPIDLAVFRKAMLGIDVRDIGDMVVVPDYVNVGGSFVKNPKGAEDVDIIIRDHADNRDEGAELKIQRLVHAKTGKDAHFVYAPRGPHSSYVPMFDLVLRAKDRLERVNIKESKLHKADKGTAYYEGLDAWDVQLLEDNWNVVQNLEKGSVLDLGCGTGRLLKMLQQSGVKVAGVDNDKTALRYCRKRGLDVREVDLEQGELPYDNGTWDNVIMVHSLEHVEKARQLLREAERVASKRVVALVPLGTRYDVTHKHRFRNKDDVLKLLGDEKFYGVHVIERTNTALAIHHPKAMDKARGLTPFGSYDPPKPTMSGLTEAFSVEELSSWAKDRTLVAEPKLNGFRVVIAKQGDQVKIMTENRDNRAAKYPSVLDVVKKIPGDFLLDCSMGIERGGKPLPRIELMTLMAANPELQENDVIVCTVFDLPYDNEDLHAQPFSERRKRLETFYNKHLKGSRHFDITRSVGVSGLEDLQRKFKEFAKLPMSEGVVVKDVDSTWSLDGSESGWAKLKVEAEIKVQVLEHQSVKGGRHTYTCGVLLGNADYTNTKEVDGSQLVVLGKTFSTDVAAQPGDILTIGVEEVIPQDGKLVWLGPRVLDKDAERKEPYAAAQIVDIARRANVLQVVKAAMRGVYLVKPHGTMIMDGRKKLIVKLKPLPDAYVGVDVYLVEDKAVLGIVNIDQAKEISEKEFLELRDKHMISLNEAKRWGFTPAYKLYAYAFKIVERFEEPVGYDPPQGVQTVIQEVDIEKARFTCECIECGHTVDSDEHCKDLECPACGGTMRRIERPGPGQVAKAEREGETGQFGNIDFAEGTSGTAVAQAHIMGIEEDKVQALKEASSRLLVARLDPARLTAALKQVIGEQGVHIDIRMQPSGKNYWEGGEIMVGNTSGIAKLAKLKQQNQKLRFGWKQSRAGEQRASIVRGPLSWMAAGKRSIEIIEPGEVGATANKYAALLNVDTFKWELYKADEHAKKFRFTDGKLFDGNYLFAFVPVGEGGRVWMMSRLSDNDHQEVTKNRAGAQQKCHYCSNDAVRSHVWANGNAYVPVCEEHNMRALMELKAQNERVVRTVVIEKAAPPLTFRIYKQVKTKQIVGGVVYEPMVEDTQGDYASEEDIQKAMYRFMEKYAKNSQRIKVQHEGKRYTFPILECFQPEHDMQRGGKTVKKGSWWLMLKVTDPAVWKLIENGELTAFSMGGHAHS